MRATFVLAAVGVWAWTASAWALNQRGTAFQVNTYTPNNQINPAVAGLIDGGFAVIWESDLQDEDGLGVYGQTFDDKGDPDSDEFEVPIYTTGDQHQVSVVGLTDGNFAVTWTSDINEGDKEHGIVARIFDTNGDSDLDDDIAVNTYTTGDQDYARAGRLLNGFVVVWASAKQDGDGLGVFGQRFDIDGGRVGSEFQANTYTKGDQRTPSVHTDGFGGFTVAWISDPSGGNGQDGSDDGCFAQRYNPSGARAGTEFQLNSITTNDQVRPSIALADSGNEFVAVWESRSLPGENPKTDGIAARRFNALAVPASTELLVNTYTTGHQEDATIASIPSGEMIVAWESTGGDTENAQKPDKDDDGVFARRLNAAGIPIGTEFQVNTYTTNEQDDPAAAELVDGDFVVVWESTAEDGSFGGIFGQRFSADVCGDANRDKKVTAPDALQILKASVSVVQLCEKCVCDANGDGSTNTSDALIVLKASVGDFSALKCNSC